MTKRATNLSVDAELLSDAKALGINLSATFEESLTQAVRAKRSEQWREENREAMEDYNRWIAENGLPLEKYRQF